MMIRTLWKEQGRRMRGVSMYDTACAVRAGRKRVIHCSEKCGAYTGQTGAALCEKCHVSAELACAVLVLSHHQARVESIGIEKGQLEVSLGLGA
eukprot:6188797-Pleurochrysis_carterae.AAC.1